MPVTLGTSGQASFNEPLELLKDCHRRIENFLEILLRVATAAPADHLDDEHRGALHAALRYFREAAPRHTQDEEESLFPRLRRSGSSTARQALEHLAALEADHRHADELHAAVEAAGQQWLAQGHLPSATRAVLTQQLEDLRSLYARHIHVEDAEVFPRAATALQPAEVAAVGQEMKQRRQLPPSNCGSQRCREDPPQTR